MDGDSRTSLRSVLPRVTGSGFCGTGPAASRHLVVLFSLPLLLAGPSLAQDTVSLSPDITIGLDGTVVTDEDVAVDNLLGITMNASLAALPNSAAVTAYDRLDNGDHLFALDTTAQLAGPLTVSPRDVVRYDGVGYAVEFDGVAAGVPPGARIEAVSRTPGGDLLLSFDTTVSLGGVVAADEDLVSWNGASFSMAFDASTQGIPASLDLDAAHAMAGGSFALSFDGSGSVGGAV